MTAKRDRLGKGLGALLGEYLGETDSGTRPETRTIPVSAIAPNPFQPRREFAEEELAELAQSIRESGLLQPVVVRPAPDQPSRYELVAGERRWRAVSRLGWADMPAIVRIVDDRTLLVLALVENIQRSDLSALEEAAGYRQLAEEFGLTQQQIAEAVGRDRSTVANAMRLLQLPASIRRYLEEGRLTAGHARALLAAGNERWMAELARRAVEEGWSVREMEERVQRARPAGARKRPVPERELTERRLEEELQRTLGTQVRIRVRGRKGRIEVPFYGPDDFERVFELLTGRSATDVAS
jgi:ParB family transcriptional regulator, chromosome partitioning protein